MTGLVTHLSFYKILFTPCSKFYRQKVENFEKIFLLQISPTLFHIKIFIKLYNPCSKFYRGKVEIFEKNFLLQIWPALLHTKTFIKPFLPFVENFTGREFFYYRFNRIFYTSITLEHQFYPFFSYFTRKNFWQKVKKFERNSLL